MGRSRSRRSEQWAKHPERRLTSSSRLLGVDEAELPAAKVGAGVEAVLAVDEQSANRAPPSTIIEPAQISLPIRQFLPNGQ